MTPILRHLTLGAALVTWGWANYAAIAHLPLGWMVVSGVVVTVLLNLQVWWLSHA